MLITVFIILSLGICGDGTIRLPLWASFLLKNLQLAFLLNKAQVTLPYCILHIRPLFVPLIVYVFRIPEAQGMAGSTQIGLVNVREGWRTAATVPCLPISHHTILRPHVLEGSWGGYIPVLCPGDLLKGFFFFFFNWKCVNIGTLQWAVKEEILQWPFCFVGQHHVPTFLFSFHWIANGMGYCLKEPQQTWWSIPNVFSLIRLPHDFPGVLGNGQSVMFQHSSPENTA